MKSLPAVMTRRQSSPYFQPRKALGVALFLGVALYYWCLITYGDPADVFRPGSPPSSHFTLYAHMWERLLQGRLDVDPAVVGLEGAGRAGKIYSPFGYFPAFLRGIASLFLDLHIRDIARISCLVAACLALLFSVRLGLRLNLHKGVSRPYFMVLVGMIALTGPCVFVLGPTFLHIESTLWGYAVLMYFADGYVSVFHGGAGSPVWKLLRLTIGCGVAFLIRAQYGVATTIPLLWIIVTNSTTQFVRKASGSRLLPVPSGTAFDRRSVVVSGLVGLPILLFAGYVNYEQSGNLLGAGRPEQYVNLQNNPSELAMVKKYGSMSVSRIPCAIEYYFVPHSDNFTLQAPFITASNINESCARLPYRGHDELEGETPLTITVPGFLIAAMIGGLSLTRAGGGLCGLSRSATVVLCAGLAAPCVVVCMFVARCLRYQIIFLPLLIVLSMAALSYLKEREGFARPIVRGGVLLAFGALFVYSAVVSHLVNLDQKLRGLGSAQDLRANTAEYVRKYMGGIEGVLGFGDREEQVMKAGMDAMWRWGDPVRAAEHFRKVLAMNPTHYGATYQLATALDRAGDPEAWVYWKKMLAMAQLARDDATTATVQTRLRRAPTPEELQAAAMKAGLETLHSKNDPGAAAEHFRKVLAINPTHYGATYQLAAALDRAGRREEAAPIWRKVLEMAGTYHDEATAKTARERLGQNP